MGKAGSNNPMQADRLSGLSSAELISMALSCPQEMALPGESQKLKDLSPTHQRVHTCVIRFIFVTSIQHCKVRLFTCAFYNFCPCLLLLTFCELMGRNIIQFVGFNGRFQLRPTLWLRLRLLRSFPCSKPCRSGFNQMPRRSDCTLFGLVKSER